ncbi:FAD-binding protein [Legionella sp. CNM-4043-24]|uniref:FAD-binding protein n=1 Tax=Legionella sp. CNM-4043-24 TaxID=3421646 RepID=UPI00403ABFE4
MPQTHWNMHQIKQCEQQLGQAMLSDEHSLVSYSVDFGKLDSSRPSAVFKPHSTGDIQSLMRYAFEQSLPVSIRAQGLSQGGQTLALEGGLIIHMEHFNNVCRPEADVIWVDANATWSDLLAASLPESRIPWVLPYNINLSIAGLISIGGIGASSFRHGIAAAHVKGLEVVTAEGDLLRLDASHPLFHACLGGQGQFAVISRVALALRPCRRQVRTFILTYLDKKQWMKDLAVFKQSADYIETFCSPALQGAKRTGSERKPFVEWLYVVHVSLEYDDEAPELSQFGEDIRPWKLQHCHDEPIASYVHRHDFRFDAMKQAGLWDMHHPWYECLVPADLLQQELDNLLASLPTYFANIVQVVPVANKRAGRFFMSPDEVEFYCVMILNPGIAPALVPGCVDVIKKMDEQFLDAGGKRYLSGFLGGNLSEHYWKKHFGARYSDWLATKQQYDPKGLFRSFLHRNHHFGASQDKQP